MYKNIIKINKKKKELITHTDFTKFHLCGKHTHTYIYIYIYMCVCMCVCVCVCVYLLFAIFNNKENLISMIHRIYVS